MNLEQQLSKAENLESLWRGLLPHLATPDRSQFLRWADMSPDNGELAHFAINRSARKAYRLAQSDAPMTGEAVARYVTSVIRNELSGNREFSSRPAADRTALQTEQEVVTP